MVIVRLEGGLGNQLFQYAAGRAVALQRNVPLKLDISFINLYPNREYRLQYFNIAAEIATKREVQDITREGSNRALRNFYALLQKLLPYYRRNVFVQRGRYYDSNLRQTTDHVYLVGYWQSEKYFIHISAQIRNELTINVVPDSTNLSIMERIDQVESVSLHIRRGDLVTNPIAGQYHGLCSLDYYHAAVNEISKTVKNPLFFVFSDDIAWARENLILNYETVFVDHNGFENDFEDLRLMSHCKHHVIANSSFSWWGAWLSMNPKKIVIAPKKWFNVSLDTSDLIPDSWLRM